MVRVFILSTSESWDSSISFITFLCNFAWERLTIINLLNVAPPLGTFVDHLKLWKSKVISKHITHKYKGWMERRETIYNSKDWLSVNDEDSWMGGALRMTGRSVGPARTSGPGGWPEEESSWVEECQGFVSEIAGRQPSGELRGRVLSSDFGPWRLVVNRRTGCLLTSMSLIGRLHHHFRNYIPAPVLNLLILPISSLISRLIFELYWTDWFKTWEIKFFSFLCLQSSWACS